MPAGWRSIWRVRSPRWQVQDTPSQPRIICLVTITSLTNALNFSPQTEEHHADNYDARSFFALHDFDSSGNWEPREILRTYGLMDDSNKHVTAERKDEILKEILRLTDYDNDGLVSRDEFVRFIDHEHKTLPDLGTGPGHHGDDEYEYEIHHWEK